MENNKNYKLFIKKIINEIKVNNNNFKFYFDEISSYIYFIIKNLDQEFENGVYIGKIIYNNYDIITPPDIILLTPNGRFEENKKICIDGLTAFHPDTYIIYTLENILLMLISLFYDKNIEGIGIINYDINLIKEKTKLSNEYNLINFKDILDNFI